MSEYWKSLPRKFCDICKCWFADNKASIQFHERGKKHQENAQKRIADIKKRGLKDQKKQQKLENDMAKIEKAAIAAYKKDLQRLEMPLDNIESLMAKENESTNHNHSVAQSSGKASQKPPKTKKTQPITIKIKEEFPQTAVKMWYEAMSEEGHKYYWNGDTSETQWEPPTEGFVSLEEQQLNEASESGATEKVDTSASKQIHIKEEKSETSICSFGPQPRFDPYGKWVTIVNEKVEDVDFQLPKQSDDKIEVSIPLIKEDRIKFKEKVVGQLADTDPNEEVTFKKRKFGGLQKRNTRQRCTDDD